MQTKPENEKMQPQDIHMNQIISAINDPRIENIYFNGFSTAIGNGDIILTLFRNGVPVKVLNTSFTVTKTLAEKLSAIVQDIEKKANVTLLTTEYVQNAMVPK